MDVDCTASTVPLSRTLRTKSCFATVYTAELPGPRGSGARACTRTATSAATATAATQTAPRTFVRVSNIARTRHNERCDDPGNQTVGFDRWLGAEQDTAKDGHISQRDRPSRRSASAVARDVSGLPQRTSSADVSEACRSAHVAQTF